MVGAERCVIWMIQNPNRELIDKYGNRKRYSKKFCRFEERNSMGIWTAMLSYDDFNNYDWEEYDPNPPIEFHEAYMDCLENGTEYLNEQRDISLTRESGKVALQWNFDGLTGYDLNHGKWKKQL